MDISEEVIVMSELLEYKDLIEHILGQELSEETDIVFTKDRFASYIKEMGSDEDVAFALVVKGEGKNRTKAFLDKMVNKFKVKLSKDAMDNLNKAFKRFAAIPVPRT